jgi:hypothetical protein
MGVVSACAFSFMSKYLHQSYGPKPMTRVDINDNNQSSNKIDIMLEAGIIECFEESEWFNPMVFQDKKTDMN